MKTIFLAILLASSVSFANRESGGGTLVRTSQGTGLLDLYLYNKEAFFSKKAGSPLPESPSYKEFGFDYLYSKDIQIVSKTLKQIDKWSVSSPIMAEFISDQVKRVPIYFTSYRLPSNKETAYIPAKSNFPSGSLQLVALYLAKTGVFVEKQKFDQLSESNQMAIIIHEALRHAQITWESGMSDETLQRVTAMVLRDPAPGMSLDHASYMNGVILSNTVDDKDLITENHKLAKAVCSFRPQHCYSLRALFVPALESIDKWLEIWKVVIESLSQGLRNNKIQSDRDQINNLLGDLVPHYIGLSSASSKIGWGQKTEQETPVKENQARFEMLQRELKAFNTEKTFFFSSSARSLRKFQKLMKSNGYFI